LRLLSQPINYHFAATKKHPSNLLTMSMYLKHANESLKVLSDLVHTKSNIRKENRERQRQQRAQIVEKSRKPLMHTVTETPLPSSAKSKIPLGVSNTANVQPRLNNESPMKKALAHGSKLPFSLTVNDIHRNCEHMSRSSSSSSISKKSEQNMIYNQPKDNRTSKPTFVVGKIKYDDKYLYQK